MVKPLRAVMKSGEARIDHGPGYRIYYAQVDRRVLLLLLGGDKRKQQSDH